MVQVKLDPSFTHFHHWCEENNFKPSHGDAVRRYFREHPHQTACKTALALMEKIGFQITREGMMPRSESTKFEDAFTYEYWQGWNDALTAALDEVSAIVEEQFGESTSVKAALATFRRSVLLEQKRMMEVRLEEARQGIKSNPTRRVEKIID